MKKIAKVNASMNVIRSVYFRLNYGFAYNKKLPSLNLIALISLQWNSECKVMKLESY